MENVIKLGISSSLLDKDPGHSGGHKGDRFLVDTLGKYVAYIPICTDPECVIGIEGEVLRFTGDPAAPRLVSSRTGTDYTEQAIEWAERQVEELPQADLCGFIFKSKSPISGMERVMVYQDHQKPRKQGVGIYAKKFMQRYPLIPVEEDGRLHDPKLRENFIERIFTLKRWRAVLSQRKSLGRLVDFHTRHKLLILSHSQNHYRIMGKLVAAGKALPIANLFKRYESLLMESLSLKTTSAKNMNVLMHLMGYFKKVLTADEKKELLEIFNQYHEGSIPLIVPITLINHFVRKYGQPYLAQQTYLHPHPVELGLRNHA
jgi:uncharacterized protein YbgA (DUF1722 family)/uncharacterized protein YbbK (DUF523 family)